MRSIWILVLAAALGISWGCASMGSGKKEKESDEIKVKFDDLPAAVKATLNKESNSAKIDMVDKETEHGKTIFEADAMVDGKNWEIKVAEDGGLISKKLDDEKEEGGKEKKD